MVEDPQGDAGRAVNEVVRAPPRPSVTTELIVRGAEVLVDGAWVRSDLVVRDGLVVEEPAGADAVVLDGRGAAAWRRGCRPAVQRRASGSTWPASRSGCGSSARGCRRFGVTAWLPTIVTTPDGVVDRALATLAAGPPAGWRGAVPLGLHLEGPFLSPRQPRRPPRGAAAAAVAGGHRGLVAGRRRRRGHHRPRPAWRAAGHRRARAAGRGGVAGPHPGDLRAGDRRRRRRRHAGSPTCSTPWRRCTTASPAWSGWPSPTSGCAPGSSPTGSTSTRRRRRWPSAPSESGWSSCPTPSPPSACRRPPGPRPPRGGVDETGVRLADGTLAGSNLALDQGVRNLVAFTGCAPEVALAAASASAGRAPRRPRPRPPGSRRPGRPRAAHPGPRPGGDGRRRRDPPRPPCHHDPCPHPERGRTPVTDTPWQGDACSLVDAFRAGERSPVEELEATLAAIEASRPQLLLLRRPRAGPARPRRPPTCRCPSAACPPAIKELEPVDGLALHRGVARLQRTASPTRTVAPHPAAPSTGAASSPSARRPPASSAGSTSASPRSTASPTTRGATAARSAARRAARRRRSPAGWSAWPPAATAAARSASRPATPACSA